MMANKVDHSALRVNQASIIGLLLLAFLMDQVWLVALVAAVMLVGTLWPKAGLFKLFYTQLLKPTGLIKPDVISDEQQPHLFAQGVGAIFLLLSLLALLLGNAVVGWLLTGIVIVLAAVNLFLGFCLGCFIYYQLARLGIQATLPSWRGA
jgi:hypothetical protein